ncbi:MAG: AbrB family transcriptional regulator [Burkholderiaceae bacterium]|jgi:membrane AbrB-like protein|nr:AbrB family transcriptional regulator [Burkholderiaceae bacterium]MDG1108793.1 AbrB family transcriptional regulator [Burkholderiaceae bacterium]MDO7553348.1 AbrB family transcriptional regulator [Burkholderiaceae bacterium]MDO7579312.1 AbrB family transcriptional regulator [Burkholderiaceae bacterium]MDO7595901.1 AbrB family transcriptional regulator [Burkholderiaceae bacterium]
MIFNTEGLLLRFRTLVIAGLGVAAFMLANWPLPFLFGPMASLLIAALMQVRLEGATVISNAGRAVLGVAIGAAITPALLHQLPAMALTMAVMPLFIAVCGLVGIPYFRRWCGYDNATAYYAAIPGGLQDMVLFGEEAGGNARTISLIQATRLFMFVIVAPFVLTHVYGVSLHNPVGVAASELPWQELLLVPVLGGIGWYVGQRIKLFGAPMIGPMILAGAASLAGILHARPPQEAILFAQVFIGIAIGAHYSGITLKELRRDIVAGLGYVVLLGGICAAFVIALTSLDIGDPVSLFLAYAPAGQAEMAVFAIVVGADLGYVIAHHIVRIVLVVVGAPVAAAVFKRSRRRP